MIGKKESTGKPAFEVIKTNEISRVSEKLLAEFLCDKSHRTSRLRCGVVSIS
jgi:hypothetical protein